MDASPFLPSEDKNGKIVYKYNQDIPLTSPHLNEEFTAPNTWKDFFWENSQGHTLRIGTSTPPAGTDVKGVIFYMVGAMEFMENDFETFRDLNAQGYAVVSYDPFGQGCSDRAHSNPHYTCPKPYQKYGDDAAEILRNIARPLRQKLCPDKQLIGLGKSQGGNHMLHMLHDHPDHGLDKVVLASPMIDLPPFSQLRKFGVVLPYARLLEASGAFSKAASPLDKLKSLTSKEPVPLPNFHVKDADFSSSAQERQRIRSKWTKENRQLANYIVTSQWMREAYKGCSRIQDKAFLQEIDVPILVAVGTKDPIVKKSATYKLFNHLPNAHLLETESKHDPFKEPDKNRNQTFHVIGEYLDDNWPNIKALRATEPAPTENSILLHSEQPLPDPAL